MTGTSDPNLWNAFVWWVYGGLGALFVGYAVYLVRLARALKEDG